MQVEILELKGDDYTTTGVVRMGPFGLMLSVLGWWMRVHRSKEDCRLGIKVLNGPRMTILKQDNI